MPRNPEDIPVTSASLRLRGDVYSSLSDNAATRFIDSSGFRETFSTQADAQGTAVDPLTGATGAVGLQVGYGQLIADYVRYGLYNAPFDILPADNTAPIDSGNPIPYWNTGGTATGASDNVRWEWVNDTSVGGYGYTLRVSGEGLRANDDVYVEQIVPARSVTADVDDHWAQVVAFSTSAAASAATFFAYLSMTFYDANGNTGSNTGDREVTVAGNAFVGGAGGAGMLLAAQPTFNPRVASNFRKAYVRIRFGIRTTAIVASAWSVSFTGPRMFRSDQRLLVTLPTAQTGNAYAMTIDNTLNAMALYNSNNTRIGLIGPQLVPIPFSLVNLAAGATTAMQLWGDTALALGTPRIEMPFAGSVVAVSWRLSAAITGGQITAVRAVTQTGTIIRNFGTLDAASGQTGNIKGSALGGGYNVDTFTAGTNLGIDLVTGGGLLPAGTLDVAVILWVAFDWSGN